MSYESMESQVAVLEPPAASSQPALRHEKEPGKVSLFPIGESIRIGRHPYNEVSVGDNSMSRFHCWVSRHNGDMIIEDLGSANGTLVNGTPIAKPTVLQPGDRVTIGRSEFEFAA